MRVVYAKYKIEVKHLIEDAATKWLVLFMFFLAVVQSANMQMRLTPSLDVSFFSWMQDLLSAILLWSFIFVPVMLYLGKKNIVNISIEEYSMLRMSKTSWLLAKFLLIVTQASALTISYSVFIILVNLPIGFYENIPLWSAPSSQTIAISYMSSVPHLYVFVSQIVQLTMYLSIIGAITYMVHLYFGSSAIAVSSSLFLNIISYILFSSSDKGLYRIFIIKYEFEPLNALMHFAGIMTLCFVLCHLRIKKIDILSKATV